VLLKQLPSNKEKPHESTYTAIGTLPILVTLIDVAVFLLRHKHKNLLGNKNAMKLVKKK
jgi:hypothetical protein